MSLTTQQINQAAAPLIRAHLEKTQLSELPAGCAPASYQDAYGIQDAVCHALWINQGQRINAWKAGAADASATPFVAPIPPGVVFDNSSTLAGTDFHEIGAEAELAYRLGKDLPPRAQPYTDAEVRDAIKCLHVTIEIIDSRIRTWREQAPCWQLADSQMNGALIVGDAYLPWQDVDHGQQKALLLVNGEDKVCCTASNTVGDPFNIMTAAINATAHRFGGLKVGDLFTAGSWTGTFFVEPGCEIIARFPGIGEAKVSIS